MGNQAERGNGLRLVVSDTGPLLHMGEADALLFLTWTGEVSIPKAVEREMTQQDPLWQSQRPAWIHVQDLAGPYKVEAAAWGQAGLLGSGEAEAIALARQVKAHWLLTDDAAARLFAQTLGIEVHGSVGIVLWAAAVGRLNRADTEAALDRLAQSSLWISPKVLTEARAALAHLFP
jgi:predicted nucleic acid-binding protein